MTAIISAMPAKTPSTVTTKRRGASELFTISGSSLTCESGCVGSTVRTASRIPAAVFPDQAACPENLAAEVRIPDHPLVNETIRNCLYEAMDLDGLRRVLAAIRDA